MGPTELSDTECPVPTGIWEWYPHSITRDNPPKQPVIKGADGKKLKHGTFHTYPYYAVIKSSKPGAAVQTFLISDGGLRAELRLIPGSGRRRTKADGGSIDGAKFRILVKGKEDAPEFKDATFSFNLEDCDDETGIIVVMGTPAGFVDLPSGSHDAGKHYVRSETRTPNAYQNDIALGSVFVHKINAFSLFLRAWDVRNMDLVNSNFQITGNQSKLFAEPSGDSSNYFQAGGNINVPYGWVYESYAGGEQHESSDMVSTSADVVNSTQQAAGFNLSGSLGVDAGIVSTSASFSYAQNQELQSKIGEVNSNEKTFFEKTVVQTDAAFVLDKRNVALSEHFKRKVKELARQIVRDGSLKPDVVESFFEQFGTHYAYAGVTGARGKMVTTITNEAIKKMLENGENARQKWEAEASVQVMGGLVSGKAGAGGENSKGRQHETRTENVFKKEDTYIVTYGGSSSDGGAPGPDNRVPVLLDLRPISDLLTVPFYYRDEATAITLHDEIAKAVKAHAFVTPGPSPVSQPLVYCKITFGKFKIDVALPVPGKAYSPGIIEKYSYPDPARLRDPSSWNIWVFVPNDIPVLSTQKSPAVSALVGTRDHLGWQRIAISPEGDTSAVLDPTRKPGPVRVRIEVEPRSADIQRAAGSVKVGLRFTETPTVNFLGPKYVDMDLTKPGAAFGPIDLDSNDPAQGSVSNLPFPIKVTSQVTIEEVRAN